MSNKALTIISFISHGIPITRFLFNLLITTRSLSAGLSAAQFRAGWLLGWC